MPSGKPIIGINDLASQRPDIAKEWDYEKNSPFLPSMFRLGSNKKFWWVCPLGHNYQGAIVDRVHKETGCPYCKGKAILVGFNDLVTTHPQLIGEWDFEKNLDITPYSVTRGSNKHVWWKCKYGHSWVAGINARTNTGCGCPVCSNQKVLVGYNDLLSKFSDIASEWDYEKNEGLTPEQVTSASHNKVYWKCKNGHSWQAPISRRTSGYGCPYCSGRYAIKGETDLASRFPEVSSEWDYDKNGNLKPDDVTAFSTKKVWWLCPAYHHSYQTTVAHRTNMKSGCPYCAGNKVLEGFNDLQSNNAHVASQWDYKKNYPLTPKMVTRCSTKNFWWKCENGHSWQIDVDHRTRGHECPYCLGSKAERLGYALLKDWKISFKREFLFKDYKVKYFPYDIYCSDGLVFEFDGIQHFKGIDYFTKEISFAERIRRDNIKNEYVFSINKPLLRIPYTYDPDKHKTDIERLMKEFISTRKIPQEIIDFYAKFNFSNYAALAANWNAQNSQ